MDYGEKWERETEGQAADAVTGVFPSLWGFPCACGSRDQLLGHGGIKLVLHEGQAARSLQGTRMAFPGA